MNNFQLPLSTFVIKLTMSLLFLGDHSATIGVAHPHSSLKLPLNAKVSSIKNVPPFIFLTRGNHWSWLKGHRSIIQWVSPNFFQKYSPIVSTNQFRKIRIKKCLMVFFIGGAIVATGWITYYGMRMSLLSLSPSQNFINNMPNLEGINAEKKMLSTGEKSINLARVISNNSRGIYSDSSSPAQSSFFIDPISWPPMPVVKAISDEHKAFIEKFNQDVAQEPATLIVLFEPSFEGAKSLLDQNIPSFSFEEKCLLLQKTLNNTIKNSESFQMCPFLLDDQGKRLLCNLNYAPLLLNFSNIKVIEEFEDFYYSSHDFRAMPGLLYLGKQLAKNDSELAKFYFEILQQCNIYPAKYASYLKEKGEEYVKDLSTYEILSAMHLTRYTQWLDFIAPDVLEEQKNFYSLDHPVSSLHFSIPLFTFFKKIGILKKSNEKVVINHDELQHEVNTQVDRIQALLNQYPQWRTPEVLERIDEIKNYPVILEDFINKYLQNFIN